MPFKAALYPTGVHRSALCLKALYRDCITSYKFDIPSEVQTVASLFCEDTKHTKGFLLVCEDTMISYWQNLSIFNLHHLHLTF